MTTILILTIDDDGVRAYKVGWRGPYSDELQPVRSGDDRGHYDVFEVAGVSIDVTRMPEAKHETSRTA